MLFRSNLDDLVTPQFDEVLLGAYDMGEKKHPKIYKVLSDDSKQVEVSNISILSDWDDMEEGEGVPQEDPVQGYNKTFLHEKKGKALKITFEAYEDDEFAVLKQEHTAKMMGRGAVTKVEKACAGIFNLHTTTAGPDGVALVDHQHPKNSLEATTYFDNELTGADSVLSHDAIEDMEILQSTEMKDMKANIIARPTKKICLVPPALEGTADRIFSERALERPSEVVRDINRYAGKYEVVCWDYLTTSTTAWWVIFPEFDALRMYWRRKPHFRHYIDEDMESYVWKGTMRYSVSWTQDGRLQVWGSVGA